MHVVLYNFSVLFTFLVGVVTCAVLNGEDKNSTRHRFPNTEKDQARCNKWIELTGNTKLPNINPKTVYNNSCVSQTFRRRR